MGGSSTPASVLKMAVVFVATNPRILNRLVKDLDDADEKGLLSPIPQYKVLLFQIPGLTRDLLTVPKETSDLSYLTAIINETLRL